MKQLIYVTLTSNSTTLYTYDNAPLINKLQVNCTELISQELGLINSMSDFKDESGSIIINNRKPVLVNGEYVNLVMYYVKGSLSNSDLITVVAVVSDHVLKEFVLQTLWKILVEFRKFREVSVGEEQTQKGPENGKVAKVGNVAYSPSQSSPSSPISLHTSLNFSASGQDSSSVLSFKKIMTSIIKKEESKYLHYGATYDATFDEIEQVRNIMNKNIERTINRGERINLLVSKTSKLTNSSNSFRRRTVALKRKMWWSNVKFIILVGILVVVMLYFLIGIECGMPWYQNCLHPSKPEQPHQSSI